MESKNKLHNDQLKENETQGLSFEETVKRLLQTPPKKQSEIKLKKIKIKEAEK